MIMEIVGKAKTVNTFPPSPAHPPFCLENCHSLYQLLVDRLLRYTP